MKYFFATVALLMAINVQAEDSASQMVHKSEQHTRGKSFMGNSKMTVHKGSESRSLGMKIWTMGQDKALVKITQPAKEKGVGNLRLELNFWQYLPNVNRIIKIPPSLMLQSWMGSDFTNDDLVRGSSLYRDYTHKIVGKEKLNGMDAVKILCTPKPKAPVVWGKVELWVRAKDSVPLQEYFYSESGELLKKLVGEDVQTFGAHTIPTKLTMEDVKKAGNKTVVEYEASSVKVDVKIDDSIFTQNNLKKQN